MYKFLPSGVFTIEPYSSGSLSGLNFSIKDNINIAQYKTSRLAAASQQRPWRLLTPMLGEPVWVADKTQSFTTWWR
ncbi:hypothetical protein HJX30_27430 (plasmid) [Klebsiella pneumoniae]|nr:hypothetical protein [Salmonella enterica subsp. enterica serovar Typhimurium]QJJ09109.1 hypothetical protein HJX30_27430 [Klebsiella pneumoniae]ECA6429799.1 hypothetical protein [Salmonella enterica subsp. enterica serovar Typhimurium]ECA8101344.1 hypothetical protein [Salmonella enterica subsp. enterica serovar Typhimurium]ECA8102692.1 hypothetical protein [Salmonella enterica subsp. enterica serovar Typhimurium]